jgi:hypothetical protein
VVATMGHMRFAECQEHLAKVLIHSAKVMPSVTLSKRHSTNKLSVHMSMYVTGKKTICRVPHFNTRQNQTKKTFLPSAPPLTLGKTKRLGRLLTVTGCLPSATCSTLGIFWVCRVSRIWHSAYSGFAECLYFAECLIIYTR